MITFICVLKSGGDFFAEYVTKLRRQINQNYNRDHRFICYTDIPEKVPGVGQKMRYNFPGWWSKFEIFATPGPAVYFDLDNIIVDDITDLEELLDIPPPKIFTHKGYRSGLPSSSIIAWTGDYSWILEAFLETEVEGRYLGPGPSLSYKNRLYRGDQDLLQVFLSEADDFHYVSDLGLTVKSYKHHCQEIIPPGTNVVGFHGKPRPPNASASWVRKYWGENDA